MSQSHFDVEGAPEAEIKYFNSFQNLCLLTDSENSSYSNKSLNEKYEVHEGKKSSYPDSLKLNLLFWQLKEQLKEECGEEKIPDYQLGDGTQSSNNRIIRRAMDKHKTLVRKTFIKHYQRRL